jgi:hypothetical protein
LSREDGRRFSEAKPGEQFEKVAKAGESVWKLAILAAGVAYVGGALITNADLYLKFQIISFSLNRAQYVVVGALWMSVVGFLYYSAYFASAFPLKPKIRRFLPWPWARLLPGCLIAFSA